MEEVIVEIPEERSWKPPVLREKEPEPDDVHSSPADIFFMQYAVCILVLTTLLILRLFDQNAYSQVAGTFREQSAAPDLPWTAQLFALAGSLWS